MTTHEPVRALDAGVPLRLLAGLSALLVLLFAITTVPGFRSGQSFDTRYDGWLQGTAYVALALAAVVRPLWLRRDRLLWGLLGLAVCLRALGFVVFVSHVRLQHPPPYPSVADYCWLAMDGCLLLTLWILLRRRIRRRSIDIAFAALQTGLTVAGVAVAVLFHTLDTISGADRADNVVVTNLAYPLLDMGMLVLVSSLLVATGIRSWSTVTLTLGIAGFAVVDAAFVYEVTAETYHPGTLLAALSLAATGAIAFSGWLPEVERPLLPTFEFSRATYAAILGLVSIATLLYGALRHVTLGGILLPAAALVVGIVRGVWLVGRNRDTALTAINATNVQLQRLADQRQNLLDRLVQAQEDERTRIAADVHDDSVQALAAVELRLGLLRRQIADAQPALLETAETLAGTVSEAIGRLRTLLFDLESPAVETDLATALSVAAENTFEDRLTWTITGDLDLDVPEGQRVTAYRIAKEAMANVARHAGAGTVTITLARSGGGFDVVVEDDGRGFDPSTVEPRRGHLGIPAMADRATIAGGRLDLVRRAQGGMRVRLWLPSDSPTARSDVDADVDAEADGRREGSA
jgi:signal transduction histidine kinase